MDMQEIRGLEPEELSAKVKELRKELFNLRFQVMSEQISNPQRIKDAKREIARMKTVMKQKESEPRGDEGSAIKEDH